MIDDWAELEALVVELRETNETWRNMNDMLLKQLESFREVTEQIEQHFDELAVYESLLTLSRRALNDAARVHTGRLNYGLTRSAAMVWYAIDDPRADRAGASPEGSYTIEVRVGPRYLLGVERDTGASGDQRMSVLIAGEKQLVATLPTTAERFRAALLRAFTAPHYSGPPREATAGANTPADETAFPAEEPETSGDEAAADAKPVAKRGPSSPRPSSPDARRRGRSRAKQKQQDPSVSQSASSPERSTDSDTGATGSPPSPEIGASTPR